MSSARERLERLPGLANLAEARKQAEAIKDRDKQARILARLDALDGYVNGDDMDTIEADTGIKRQKVDRFSKRFNLYGFAGITGEQVGKRKANPALLDRGESVPNQLTALFQEYQKQIEEPWLAAVVHGKLEGKPAGPPLSNPEARELLMSLSRAVGIAEGKFPLGFDNCLLRTLPRRIAKERAKEKGRKEAVAAAVTRALQDTYGPPPEFGPYIFVQMDAHKVDITFTIVAPSLRRRGTVSRVVHYIQIIVIWEVYSGAILGYSVAFGTNYKAADVCQAVQRALVPWTKRNLSSPKLKYKKGDCLPNAAHPALAYLCFDNMFCDRALSNMADDLRTFCDATVRCAILPGPISHPNGRAEIENLFHQIEEAIFHNLPISTGSNPEDERASNGGRRTLRSATLALVLDLIDVTICRWNNSKAEGCDQTRNALLIHEAERGETLFRRIPESERAELLKYDMIVNYHFNKHGKLYWIGADYEFPDEALKLYTHEELVNQEILIWAHSADLREIKIRLRSNGRLLGKFTIEKRFRGSPQPLQIRLITRESTRGHGFAESAADLSIAARLALISRVENGDVDAAHLARMVYDAQRAEAVAEARLRGKDVEAATTGDDDDETDLEREFETNESEAPTNKTISDQVRKRLAKLSSST